MQAADDVQDGDTERVGATADGGTPLVGQRRRHGLRYLLQRHGESVATTLLVLIALLPTIAALAVL